MDRPKVIFFDAVGTVIGLRGGVGKIYRELAQQHAGVEVSESLLNHAFAKSFEAAPSLAVNVKEPWQVKQREYLWWQSIARQTFEQVGAFERFENFSKFFARLYDHFETVEPWLVYDDVREALEGFAAAGIELGIISNFDSRLYNVLKAFELNDFFASITLSSMAGSAKPDPTIFAKARKKHKCEASEAWHIGDSFREDYEGARAAGLRGIWLRREET